MTSKRRDPTTVKSGHHPRSRHRALYDFDRLIADHPPLAPFVAKNKYGDDSVDFANPRAVRTLNHALLVHFYGVTAWSLPDRSLSPPVPGRADHIHQVADLLAEDRGALPTGDAVSVLDIGVGASCIYPIIGRHQYGWRFVGTDVDPVAIESARAIIAANPHLKGGVEVRPTENSDDIFRGVTQPGERFDVSICNPPFHESEDEATAANLRKRRGLAPGGRRRTESQPSRNFGGRPAELWCDGGERGFILRMIEQSAEQRTLCGWFTTLVSKRETLPSVERALAQVEATSVRTVSMQQGQKSSRIVAWSFLTDRAAPLAKGKRRVS